MQSGLTQPFKKLRAASLSNRTKSWVSKFVTEFMDRRT